MQFIYLLMSVLRGRFFSFIYRKNIKRAGRNFKFFHAKFFEIGDGFCVGDCCWLEAVSSYRGQINAPAIVIGEQVKLSDAVHISVAASIKIGSGVLIGSNVYIGDHSHGSTKIVSEEYFGVPPADRPLADFDEIVIGDNVWIGNGAVILAGTHIADGSIVGANSVVKGKYLSRSIIAGLPAKEIRKL